MRYLSVFFLFLAVLAVAWSSPGAAADRNNGRELYDEHCAGCHGQGGRSIDPTVPSFADGDGLFMMDSELVERIRRGSEFKPSFRGLLSDQEIRDIIAYLRTL